MDSPLGFLDDTWLGVPMDDPCPPGFNTDEIFRDLEAVLWDGQAAFPESPLLSDPSALWLLDAPATPLHELETLLPSELFPPVTIDGAAPVRRSGDACASTDATPTSVAPPATPAPAPVAEPAEFVPATQPLRVQGTDRLLIRRTLPYAITTPLPPGTVGYRRPVKRPRPGAADDDGAPVVTFTTDDAGKVVITPVVDEVQLQPVKQRQLISGRRPKNKSKKSWFNRGGGAYLAEAKRRLERERSRWTCNEGEAQFLAKGALPKDEFSRDEVTILKTIRALYVMLRLQEKRGDACVNAYLVRGSYVFTNKDVDDAEKHRLRQGRERFLRDVMGGHTPTGFVHWGPIIAKYAQEHAALLERLQRLYYRPAFGCAFPLTLQTYFGIDARPLTDVATS